MGDSYVTFLVLGIVLVVVDGVRGRTGHALQQQVRVVLHQQLVDVGAGIALVAVGVKRQTDDDLHRPLLVEVLGGDGAVSRLTVTRLSSLTSPPRDDGTYKRLIVPTSRRSASVSRNCTS